MARDLRARADKRGPERSNRVVKLGVYTAMSVDGPVFDGRGHWLPPGECIAALARVLGGQVNPSGRLRGTFRLAG